MTTTVSRAIVTDANFPSLTLTLEGSGARLNYRCKDRAEFDHLTGGVAGGSRSRVVNVTHERNRVTMVEVVT